MLQDALDVLKSHRHSRQRRTEAVYTEVSAKVEAAKAAHRQVSISGMLKFLGVSRSGYHAFLQRKYLSPGDVRRLSNNMIQQIYDRSNQNYGAPKITRELRRSGVRISERTVRIYMKEMGIKAQWVKPWTSTTRNSDFSNSKLHNILDEHFNPEPPNAVWCTDITYIWTHDGFVYLTSSMNLYARKIIAWTLSDCMEVSCVIDTINKAKARRCTSLPLIIHSDRGEPVCFTGLLQRHNRNAAQLLTYWISV